MMDMSEFSKLDLAEGKDFIVRFRAKSPFDEWYYGNILFIWDSNLWDHVWAWDMEGLEIEILAWVPVDDLVFYIQDDGTINNEYLINNRL